MAEHCWQARPSTTPTCEAEIRNVDRVTVTRIEQVIGHGILSDPVRITTSYYLDSGERIGFFDPCAAFSPPQDTAEEGK